MATTIETRTATCATHGTVNAERPLPELTFPFLITAPKRYLAKRKPFRCPQCGSSVTPLPSGGTSRSNRRRFRRAVRFLKLRAPN